MSRMNIYTIETYLLDHWKYYWKIFRVYTTSIIEHKFLYILLVIAVDLIIKLPFSNLLDRIVLKIFAIMLRWNTLNPDLIDQMVNRAIWNIDANKDPI